MGILTNDFEVMLGAVGDNCQQVYARINRSMTRFGIAKMFGISLKPITQYGCTYEVDRRLAEKRAISKLVEVFAEIPVENLTGATILGIYRSLGIKCDAVGFGSSRPGTLEFCFYNRNMRGRLKTSYSTFVNLGYCNETQHNIWKTITGVWDKYPKSGGELAKHYGMHYYKDLRKS